MGGLPARPEASSRAVSLVLWWPSTVSRLRELSIASPKAFPSKGLLIAASVVMNKQGSRHIRPDHPGALDRAGDLHHRPPELELAVGLLELGVGGHDGLCKRQSTLRRVGEQGGSLVDPSYYLLHRQLVADDAGRGNEHFLGLDTQVPGRQGAHLLRVGQTQLAGAGIGIAGVDHDGVGLAALEVLPADLHPRRDDLVRGKHGRRRCPRRAHQQPQVPVPRNLHPRRKPRRQKPLRRCNTIVFHNCRLVPSHLIQVARPLERATKHSDLYLGTHRRISATDSPSWTVSSSWSSMRCSDRLWP